MGKSDEDASVESSQLDSHTTRCPTSPVSYTRTGRISKARKGRKVHRCECGRTYTREEHLRRHQKNHAQDALVCDFPDCGKTFYRHDLLQRHQERHNEVEKDSRRPEQMSAARGHTVAVAVEALPSSVAWADPFNVSPNYSSSSGYASPIPGTGDYANMFANPPYGPGSNRTRTSSNASFIEPWSYPSRSPTSATSTMAYTWTSNDKSPAPSGLAYMATAYPMTSIPLSARLDPIASIPWEGQEYPWKSDPVGHKPFRPPSLKEYSKLISLHEKKSEARKVDPELTQEQQENRVKIEKDEKPSHQQDDTICHSMEVSSSQGDSQSYSATSEPRPLISISASEPEIDIVSPSRDNVLEMCAPHVDKESEPAKSAELEVSEDEDHTDSDTESWQESSTDESQFSLSSPISSISRLVISTKTKIIDKLMKEVHISLFNISCHQTTTTSQNQTSSGALVTSSRTSSSSNINNGERKRALDDKDNGCSDGEEEGNNKRRKRGNGQQPEGNDRRVRFACPFFKRKPRSHTGTPCRYPGFTGVHRMKEHLYRVHILVHCHRCHRVFKTETELREHQRATEPCIVSNRDPPEGIDTAQLARLKSKKRFGKERTEEEKWRAIYHFLFPEEDATLVSPYCDDFTDAQEQTLVPLTDYEIFCRSEYPRRIRQELDSFCDQIAHPIEDQLRAELVNIAQRVRDTLYPDFQRQRQTSTPSSQAPAPVIEQNVPNGIGVTDSIAPLTALTPPPSLDLVSGSGMNTTSLSSETLHNPTINQQPTSLPIQSPLNLNGAAGPFQIPDIALFPSPSFVGPQLLQDLQTFSWVEQCNEIGAAVQDVNWMEPYLV